MFPSMPSFLPSWLSPLAATMDIPVSEVVWKHQSAACISLVRLRRGASGRSCSLCQVQPSHVASSFAASEAITRSKELGLNSSDFCPYRMESRLLGNTPVELPVIGFGSWNYSGGVGPLRAAIERGACFID